MFNLLQKEEIFRDVPHAPVLAMARRWNDHFKAKRFRLAMPADTPLGASVGPEDFWTSPLSYGTLPLTEPALFALALHANNRQLWTLAIRHGAPMVIGQVRYLGNVEA